MFKDVMVAHANAWFTLSYSYILDDRYKASQSQLSIGARDRLKKNFSLCVCSTSFRRHLIVVFASLMHQVVQTICSFLLKKQKCNSTAPPCMLSCNNSIVPDSPHHVYSCVQRRALCSSLLMMKGNWHATLCVGAGWGIPDVVRCSVR